jgi:hypothetical protein
MLLPIREKKDSNNTSNKHVSFYEVRTTSMVVTRFDNLPIDMALGLSAPGQSHL